jgi:hypothetical protein
MSRDRGVCLGKRARRTVWREPDGRVPVLETNAEARADAFVRVPAFLVEKLGR